MPKQQACCQPTRPVCMGPQPEVGQAAACAKGPTSQSPRPWPQTACTACTACAAAGDACHCPPTPHSLYSLYSLYGCKAAQHGCMHLQLYRLYRLYRLCGFGGQWQAPPAAVRVVHAVQQCRPYRVGGASHNARGGIAHACDGKLPRCLAHNGGHPWATNPPALSPTMVRCMWLSVCVRVSLCVCMCARRRCARWPWGRGQQWA